MIYIHFPFCKSFCTYCDFYSVRGKDRIAQYTQSLLREISLRKAFLCQCTSPAGGGGGYLCGTPGGGGGLRTSLRCSTSGAGHPRSGRWSSWGRRSRWLLRCSGRGRRSCPGNMGWPWGGRALCGIYRRGQSGRCHGGLRPGSAAARSEPRQYGRAVLQRPQPAVDGPAAQSGGGGGGLPGAALCRVRQYLAGLDFRV